MGSIQDWANVYGGQYLKQDLAGSFNQGVQETLDFQAQAKERDRDALRDNMLQLQYSNLLSKQYEGLTVPADTGLNNADIAIQTASRQLVDQASNLTNQLKKGEIDTDTYAKDLAVIRSQVPAIANFKEQLTGGLQTYQKALADGQISKAMDDDAVDFYGSLLADDGKFQFGVDENNNVTLTGVTEVGGKPVNIPVSGAGNMYKPILKQPAPYETLKPLMDQFAKGNPVWNDDMGEAAKQQLDNIIGQDNNAALSLAVDHFGLPLDQAKLMQTQRDADGENELSKFVEAQWLETATNTFVGDRLQEDKERIANAINQQRLNMLKSGETSKTGQLTPNQAQIVNQRKATAQHINTVVDEALKHVDDPNTMIKFLEGTYGGNIEKVGYKEGDEGSSGILGFGKRDAVPATYQIYVKGRKYPIDITDPAQLKATLLRAELGGVNAGEFIGGSPINRNSPLKQTGLPETPKPSEKWNEETKRWEGDWIERDSHGRIKTGAGDVQKLHQLYGDEGWGAGEEKARELYGTDEYLKTKEEWLKSGGSEKGFRQNWDAEKNSELGKKHLMQQRGQKERAAAELAAFRQSQSDAYGALSPEDQASNALALKNLISKDPKLAQKLRGKTAGYGAKNAELFNELLGGAGYADSGIAAGTQGFSPEQIGGVIEGLEKAGVNPREYLKFLKQ